VNFQVKFDINEKIFVKDPQSGELGKLIVKNAIDLIFQIGFEQFNFKKLALEINSTEAGIYRYFENKHRLLLYIVNWYWCYMKFVLTFKLENVADKKERLKIIVHLLTHEIAETGNRFSYNGAHLHAIILSEGSKVYLTKHVTEENGKEFFKPYNDLCDMIANAICAYNSQYQYAKSLSSTLIETAHRQQFFNTHIPKLTGSLSGNKPNSVNRFLEHFLFSALQIS